MKKSMFIVALLCIGLFSFSPKPYTTTHKYKSCGYTTQAAATNAMNSYIATKVTTLMGAVISTSLELTPIEVPCGPYETPGIICTINGYCYKVVWMSWD